MMEKPDTAAHTPAVYDDIDDLTFDYDGNQIVKVTDAVDDGPYYQGAWHYRDRADQPVERCYDGNGNLTKDLDAKISDIQYNSLNLSLMNVGCGSEKPKQVWFFAYLSLNLPIMITFTDGSTTRYTYDATGRKLRTEHRVMTTGVFNPGLDDGGTAVPDTGGIALPFPDDPGLAVGEGGLGAWPEMSVFEELEQLLGEELAEGEEMEAGGETALPATELPVPVGTGTSSLPYELTVDAKINSLSKKNSKIQARMDQGGLSEKKLKRLQNKLFENNIRITNLNQSKDDIDLLGDDPHNVYVFSTIGGGEHHVRLGDDNRVYIETSSDGLLIHEITHIRQSLMAGGLDFSGKGELLNVGNKYKGEEKYMIISNMEIEACKMQYSYDKSFPGNVKSINDINIYSVGEIMNGGNPTYLHIYKYMNYLKARNRYKPAN